MHDKIDGYHVIGAVSIYRSLTEVEMNIPVMTIIIPDGVFSWSAALYLYHGYIKVSDLKKGGVGSVVSGAVISKKKYRLHKIKWLVLVNTFG